MNRFALIVLALALSTATRAEAGNFTKGPWLQNVTTDGITVMWEDGGEAGGGRIVEYGLSAACELGSVTATSEAFNDIVVYSARIEGLATDTIYHYKAVSGATVTLDATFKTSIATGATGYRYYVTGDSRSNPGQWGRIADQIITDMREFPEHHQSFIINTGDIAEDGTTYVDWDQFQPASLVAIRELPIYVGFGNHEDRGTDESEAYLAGYFDFPYAQSGSTNEKWFSFRFGNAHYSFISIYDDAGYSSGDQYDWLVADLAAASADAQVGWIFSTLHFIPWSLGGHDYDDAADLRENLHPVFSDAPVDCVFGGHNHLYARYAPIDGVTYLTSGGAGASLHSEVYDPWAGGVLEGEAQVHHHVVVDVEGETVAMRAIDNLGNRLDYVTLGGTDIDRPPLADAGLGVLGTVDTAVDLDGSASEDPEGSTLTYEWTQLSGPTATLAYADTATPSFTPSGTGNHVFQLIVDDGIYISAPDYVRAEVFSGVESFAPVADTFVYEDDPDGDYGDRTYLQLDLGNSYAPRENQYAYLRFDVSGIDGFVASARLRIYCTNPGSIAEIFTSSEVTWDEHTLTWESLLPVDGPLAGYLNSPADEAWTEADVTPAITGDGLVTFVIMPTGDNGADFHSREGEHPPELIVTFNDDIPPDPVCSVAASANQVINGEEVSFTGTATPTAGATIVSMQWDFDFDGYSFTNDASGESVSHDFWGVGNTNVAMRATDDAGRTCTSTVSVTVYPVDPVDPDAESGCGCSFVY